MKRTNYLFSTVIAPPVLVHIPLFSLSRRAAPAASARLPLHVLPLFCPRTLPLSPSLSPSRRLVFLSTIVAVSIPFKALVSVHIAVAVAAVIPGRAMHWTRPTVVVIVSAMVPSPPTPVPPVSFILFPPFPLPVALVVIPRRFLSPPTSYTPTIVVLCNLP